MGQSNSTDEDIADAVGSGEFDPGLFMTIVQTGENVVVTEYNNNFVAINSYTFAVGFSRSIPKSQKDRHIFRISAHIFVVVKRGVFMDPYRQVFLNLKTKKCSHDTYCSD